MAFLGGIWAKLIAGLAAVAALIGAIFLYNRNQQKVGEAKVKAQVADEAQKADTKMQKAGEKFVKQGAAEQALKDHNF
jgi:predicted histidine transporter YuiF (NhaC family)